MERYFLILSIGSSMLRVCLWPQSLKLPGWQWSVRPPICCDSPLANVYLFLPGPDSLLLFLSPSTSTALKVPWASMKRAFYHPVACVLLPFVSYGSRTCTSSVSHLGSTLFLRNTSQMAEGRSQWSRQHAWGAPSTWELGRARVHL